MEKKSAEQWRPVIKLRIERESTFLGPGSRQLLSLIEETGSVRLASQKMNMSYSKAWKILNNMEEQLGYQVVERRQGGRGGGETTLTVQGKILHDWFKSYESECNQAINIVFEKRLPELMNTLENITGRRDETD